MMWPISWARMAVVSSSSKFRRIDEFTSMKGSFTPRTPALRKGLWVTKTSGR